MFKSKQNNYYDMTLYLETQEKQLKTYNKQKIKSVR